MTDGWVEKTLSGLNTERLVGQLLAPRAASHYVSSDSDAHRRLIRLARQGVGGFVLFQGEVLGQALLVNDLQQESQIPLLFGQDAEWGVGMRLDDATSFPSMTAIAASGDPEHAYTVGRTTAAEARALGVYHVYAPVVDINSNRENPIINVRSFGEDPTLVSEMAVAVVRGLQDGGVLATAKHFPGHGDTAVDSHSDLPVLPFDVERLESLEWLPFVAAIKAGVASVMVGHLAMTAIDGPAAGPASLSRNVVTGLLRERLGYKGLVVSDALDMNGIQKGYPPGEAAVRAVEAGVDLLLTSPDDDAAFQALVAAVDSGRIGDEHLRASVRRILAAKERIGLVDTDATSPNPQYVRSVVRRREHVAAASAAARDGVTLLKNEGALPISDGANVLIVSMNDTDRPTNRTEAFVTSMRAASRGGKLTHIELCRDIYAEQAGAVMEAAAEADLVVFAVVVAVRSFSGEIGMPPDQSALIGAVAKRGSVAVVSLGSPYAVAEIIEAVDVAILGYGHAVCMQRACADALTGRHPIQGRLPITVSETLPFGFGLKES